MHFSMQLVWSNSRISKLTLSLSLISLSQGTVGLTRESEGANDGWEEWSLVRSHDEEKIIIASMASSQTSPRSTLTLTTHNHKSNLRTNRSTCLIIMRLRGMEPGPKRFKEFLQLIIIISEAVSSQPTFPSTPHYSLFPLLTKPYFHLLPLYTQP